MVDHEMLKFMAEDDSQPLYQELAQEVLASRWTPISPDNLPRLGDEVLCIDQGDGPNRGKIFDLYYNDSPARTKAWTADNYLNDWCTHFRPINAPEREEEQEHA